MGVQAYAHWWSTSRRDRHGGRDFCPKSMAALQVRARVHSYRFGLVVGVVGRAGLLRSTTISANFFSCASWSAVLPSLSFSEASALLRRSSATIARSWLRTALCKAVRPILVAAFTRAPLEMSKEAISVSPSLAAIMRAVPPASSPYFSLRAAFTSAPFSIRSLASGVLCNETEAIRAVSPDSLLALMSAPAAISSAARAVPSSTTRLFTYSPFAFFTVVIPTCWPFANVSSSWGSTAFCPGIAWPRVGNAAGKADNTTRRTGRLEREIILRILGSPERIDGRRIFDRINNITAAILS
jgi:hypothetical protein